MGRGLVAFFLGLLLTGTLSAQEMRTWSDATGQFKIQAKLQSVGDGKVTLLCADGTAVEIELNKLSAEDQKYAASQQASPFKPAPSGVPPTDGAGPAAGVAVAEAKLIRANWKAVKPMVGAPGIGWKLRVSDFEKPVPGKNVAIPIPAPADSSERLQALVPNHVGTRVVVGYVLDRNQEGSHTRLVLADLGLGKALALKPVVGTKMVPLALSDSGTEVLLRSEEFGIGGRGRLELWRISSSGVSRIMACMVDDRIGLKWAAFLDASRFATLSSDGMLVIWNAATFQPGRGLKMDPSCEPALSPDRKYLACVSGQQVGVLDLSAGRVVAAQSVSRLSRPQLCFSPDGSKLACATSTGLFIWNVADGSLDCDINFAGQRVLGDGIVWLRDQYLLVGRNSVFDIDNQVQLWKLEGHEKVEKCGAVCVFAVAPRNTFGALVAATVPSPAFDAAMAKAMQAPDFFVLKQGVTVKLNLDGLPDAGERENAREALTKKLQENGIQVGPEGTIELVGSVTEAQEREVAYGNIMSGPFGAHTVYKIREFTSQLKFVYQGQLVWTIQTSSLPGIVMPKEGETVEQVLRRNEKPNYQLFTTTQLPKVLLKPMGPNGLGSSQVTVSGIQ